MNKLVGSQGLEYSNLDLLKLNDKQKYKVMLESINEKKATDEQIMYMTYHDRLTKLPNNIYFEYELEKAIKESIISHNEGAVIFIDVDNFNEINNSFGHNYGDILLIIISELMKSCVGDFGMVARMSGDEFLILLPKINSRSNLKNICDLIIKNFENPFEIKEIQAYSSVSMGLAIFPYDNVDKTEILKRSDIAMHYAKSRGKNNYVFYDEKLHKSYRRKKIIENGLRKALENNEFELYYQPQINIKSNKIRGMEALLRWTSLELGRVSPEEFIPIAEESGLMCKIGDWVLKEACAMCKSWKSKGYIFDVICVNISPVQIKNNYFFDNIVDVLSLNKLEPEDLEVEITEGILIKSVEEKSKLFQKLIDKNVKIAIDDFGKGYSSLNYLTVLPINTLKIDKSFIDNICLDDKSLFIVESILALSKKLNYNVVAEGVEKEDQKFLLKKNGCDNIQGYYYSKPVKAEIMEDMLKTEFIA